MLWRNDPTGTNHDKYKKLYERLEQNGEGSFHFRMNKDKIPSFEKLDISKNQNIKDDYTVPKYMSKIMKYEASYMSY
jgi:hypothetical protein